VWQHHSAGMSPGMHNLFQILLLFLHARTYDSSTRAGVLHLRRPHHLPTACTSSCGIPCRTPLLCLQYVKIFLVQFVVGSFVHSGYNKRDCIHRIGTTNLLCYVIPSTRLLFSHQVRQRRIFLILEIFLAPGLPNLSEAVPQIIYEHGV
jgi:hypothetical protein